MDNFDLKNFLGEKSLLKENSPGYDTRKQGEALPTLASVKAAYEAKNGNPTESINENTCSSCGSILTEEVLTEGIITEGKKSELDKKLAEIDKEGTCNTLEAKIAAIDEAIEAKTSRISMVQEDENLSELIDKKRVKEMQKEIKLLERSKKLYEKQLDKANGVKTEKKEIVDEYNSEPHDEPDMSMDATMDEESEYKY